MRSKRHRILKTALLILLILLAAAAVLIVYLTVTEYRPKDEETLNVSEEVGGQTVGSPGSSRGGKALFSASASEESGTGTAALPAVKSGKDLALVTWNIGYGALGDNADFFMDGGSSVTTADQARVQTNLAGITDELTALNPDFVFLQEADVDSARSHHANETQTLSDAFADANEGSGAATFAYNFKVKFIPYPIPPIGKVESGILTLSRYHIASSARVQLPCPFKWPVRTANLKRCLMIDRIPVTDGTGKSAGKELVLVNLHLEAYDSGEGKAAQTAMLRDILQEEADRGNYVIAGGDFNQTFSGTDDSRYPEYEGRWHCGEIDESGFDDNWQFLMDNRTPTCRSLDQSYRGKDDATFQFYMIDGFIVSANVETASVETQDLKFVCSDHNPVKLVFRLS